MTAGPHATLYSLQIGRGLAALAVLLQHSALMMKSQFADFPALGYELLSIGYLGVDYFFVLSGFIIAYATQGMRQDKAGASYYFRARAIRIYTPYLPIAFVMLAILVVLPTVSLRNFSWFASLTLLPGPAPTVLSVAWSLQNEIIFYLVFGLCFFGFRNIWLILLWYLPTPLLFFVEVPRWVHTLIGTINVEFFFGMAACYLYLNGKLFSLRYPLLVLGILLVLLGCVLLLNGYNANLRLIAGLGYAAIVLSLVFMERHADFSRFRVLVFLGAASYSIYLAHKPALSVLLQIQKLMPHWSIAFIVTSILSCLAGIAYFKIVEQPLTAYFKKRYLTAGSNKA